MKNCVGRGQKLVWFSSNFSIFVRNSFCRWHSNEKIDSKILFNVYSFEGCVGMTLIFCSHLALWWVKKETLHFVLSFGKIALSKLLQNVESPFRGAAPLKAHIAPQDPVEGWQGRKEYFTESGMSQWGTTKSVTIWQQAEPDMLNSVTFEHNASSQSEIRHHQAHFSRIIT